MLNDEIDYPTSLQILNNLCDMHIIDESNVKLLSSAISPKALSMPIKIENKQRANILKNILINIVKG